MLLNQKIDERKVFQRNEAMRKTAAAAVIQVSYSSTASQSALGTDTHSLAARAPERAPEIKSEQESNSYVYQPLLP